MINRIASLISAASVSAALFGAATLTAAAAPSYEIPEPWTYAAIDKLAADGLLDGYPDHAFRGDRPRTRADVAKLIARAIAKARRAGNVSRADLARLQRLADDYRYELVLIGVRITSVSDALLPAGQRPSQQGFSVQGAVVADQSFRDVILHPAMTGTDLDPFINAYLTSPADNDPFDHQPNTNVLRFDTKVSPTYAFNENVALSLPIHVQQYDSPFTSPGGYVFEPALVLNVGHFAGLHDFYVRGGQLDNLASSRLGLTYSAPDATKQGGDFQNPAQPYENGIELGGRLGRTTQFQVAWSTIDQSMVDTFPGAPYNNYFLTVTPGQSSYFQSGAATALTGTVHTDTYTASAGPVPSLYLSQKAAIGSVYISAVNGTVCTPAGLTPGGAPCPIRPGTWYYIDQTNQVVFQAPLPAGSIVQVSYNTGAGTGSSAGPSQFGYTREHFTARVNQEIPLLPGTEVGFSLSRIVDAGTSPTVPTYFGNGYGALSDTVMGVDARIPLTFVPAGVVRAVQPVLYAEGAYSKYTPDAFNLAPVTDSAAVLGLRLRAFGARATVQYQAVGANFLDGGPLEYLGPAPATFAGWRGTFMPGFFGFANNLAINQTFDGAVTPGCTTACTSRNPALTYIYPVFNPFAASGPEFFSNYAPNTRGFSGELTIPIGNAVWGNSVFVRAQRLSEITPDAFGQITYGPGFASGTAAKFDKLEGGFQLGLPLHGSRATANLTIGTEHLSRRDQTAYAYVPFNLASGSADSAASAADNAYLAGGATPVLFYPNFVDEYHGTIAPSVSVPLTRHLTFNAVYDMQTYHGSYGTTLGQNIAQHKNDASASLNYTIPRTTQSIGVLFGNQQYTDYVVPAFNYSQNREAVDFAVRF